ncbi:MAG: YihA family ribosome biogenesis GTP-binding protein [Bacteroidetes bacterium]|nr:YihA family ribosome biogenesis GTP-binding protein [Bacteroidota bacterium]
MVVKEIKFVMSSPSVDKCPKEHFPEYVFIGRSNVGKSSLLNAMANNKSLAFVSSKPGKTILINHFIVNNSFYLVDLPGYGYAKASKLQQQEITTLLADFFSKRKSISCVFVLIDARLPLQQIDREFLLWLGEKEVPIVILLTKTDKLGQQDRIKNRKNIENALLAFWSDLPIIIETSAEKKIGIGEIFKTIESANKNYFSEQE